MPSLVELKGVKQLARYLEKVIKEAERSSQKELTIISSRIAASARQKAPSDTGSLGESIYVMQENPSTVLVIVEQPYAINVEYGTQDHPAQPFMRPAAKEAAANLPSNAAKLGRKIVG